MNSFKKLTAILTILLSGFITSAQAAIWVTPIQGGEIRFNDWNYTGPQGQNAHQFSSNGTFDGATQIQHVVTTNPDRLTPDGSYTFLTEFDNIPIYRDANLDAQVNFYKWGYTTTGGSTFNNMQIDIDGDYFVARNDMVFNFFDVIDYQYEGTTPIGDLNFNAAEGISETKIKFQPYALSDAVGWCGSVMASNPAAIEAMSGQVTFDFGFEAFLPSYVSPDPGGAYVSGSGSMQIVNDFIMRSYGTLEIEVSVANGGQGDFLYTGDAVVNNTNPTASPVTLTDGNGDPILVEVPVYNTDGSPALDENGNPRTMWVPQKEVGGSAVDENYYNKVSFMGGGIVPAGVWVLLADGNLSVSNENIVAVLDVDGNGNPIVPAGLTGDVVYHQNSFAGYPFLMRADGLRIIDAFDFDLYNDFSNVPASGYDEFGNLINLEGAVIQNLAAVPVPAAAWLFGSGLIGMISIARRRKHKYLSNK